MSNEQLIKDLRTIKLSIIKNASDVLWIENSNETVCERIDYMLLQLGLSYDDLEKDYQIKKEGV